LKKNIFIFILLTFFIGCATQKPLYNWGNYQDVSYQYMKNNTEEDLDKLLVTYQYLIDNQKVGRKVVPPGICADYGYFLIKNGKFDEGLTMMKMEIELYPESSVFIEGIIRRIEANE